MNPIIDRDPGDEQDERTEAEKHEDATYPFPPDYFSGGVYDEHDWRL